LGIQGWIARHDLAHPKSWRGLLVSALDPTRRLVTAHAVFTVQRAAEPGFHPLPPGNHEDVANAGESQGSMQRHTCGGGRQDEVIVASQDR